MSDLSQSDFNLLKKTFSKYRPDTMWFNYRIFVPACSPSDILQSIFSSDRQRKIARISPGDYINTYTPDYINTDTPDEPSTDNPQPKKD